MSLPLLLIIVSLAAHRITHFLIADALTDAARARLRRRWSGSLADEALDCAWCVGFWVSAALVTGCAQIVSIPLPGLFSLAVSSVVGILTQWEHHDG
jgi:hypothetical protein